MIANAADLIESRATAESGPSDINANEIFDFGALPACVIVRDQPIMKPRHLVHPVTGDLMLLDARGEEVCPTCGARYRRSRNAIELLE